MAFVSPGVRRSGVRAARGKLTRLLSSDGTLVANYQPGSQVGTLTATRWNNALGNDIALVLPGVAGNYASTPDHARLDIVGDIDFIAKVASDNWTVGTVQTIFGKYAAGGAGTSSYIFRIQATTGKLQVLWSVLGGATLITATSSAAVGFTNGVANWVRATLDVDNGAAGNDVIFYTSADGVSWTQLGTTVTTANTTSIYDSTTILTIGSLSPATTDLFVGKIYRAQIYNGIAGTLVFDADFSAQARDTTSFAESANGATVTINSTAIAVPARIGDKTDLTQAVAAGQPILLPFSGEKYAWLPGVAGNYYSSPDSVAASITGDIDLRGLIAQTWTTSTSGLSIVSKDSATGVQRSYGFQTGANGKLVFFYTNDGSTTAGRVATSDAAVTFTGSAIGYVRATYVAATGKVNFYQSSDLGATWQAVGTEQSLTAGAIQDGTNPVTVGANGALGATGLFVGRIYRAQIYNGINGTLAVDFNAADWPETATNAATQASSTTGEVWTLNNTGAKLAQIVGSTQVLADGTAHYMKTAAFPLVQPTEIWFVGKQVTWTSGDDLFDGVTNVSGMIIQTGSTPQLAAFAGASLASATNPALNTKNIVTVLFNGVNSSIQTNTSAATTGDVGAANMNGFTLADRSATGSNANIQASEIILLSAASSAAKRAQIYSLLKALHGTS